MTARTYTTKNSSIIDNTANGINNLQNQLKSVVTQLSCISRATKIKINRPTDSENIAETIKSIFNYAEQVKTHPEYEGTVKTSFLMAQIKPAEAPIAALDKAITQQPLTAEEAKSLSDLPTLLLGSIENIKQAIPVSYIQNSLNKAVDMLDQDRSLENLCDQTAMDVQLQHMHTQGAQARKERAAQIANDLEAKADECKESSSNFFYKKFENQLRSLSSIFKSSAENGTPAPTLSDRIKNWLYRPSDASPNAFTI